MKKSHIPITMSLFTAPLIYNYNSFHIGFEVISYDYNKLCSHLKHLIIEFLVAKDKIRSSEIKSTSTFKYCTSNTKVQRQRNIQTIKDDGNFIN
jgi:hypothetical protein